MATRRTPAGATVVPGARSASSSSSRRVRSQSMMDGIPGRGAGWGVGTRIRPYVVVGVVVAVLLAAASLWLAHHPFLPGPLILGLAPVTLWVSQLATPALAIGLALLVLA
jgi:hypothetical protein